MKALEEPLSRFEEIALQKVGFGSDESLEPRHVRHLLQLDLIEWTGLRWSLTAVGRQRYASLIYFATDHRM